MTLSCSGSQALFPCPVGHPTTHFLKRKRNRAGGRVKKKKGYTFGETDVGWCLRFLSQQQPISCLPEKEVSTTTNIYLIVPEVKILKQILIARCQQSLILSRGCKGQPVSSPVSGGYVLCLNSWFPHSDLCFPHHKGTLLSLTHLTPLIKALVVPWSHSDNPK